MVFLIILPMVVTPRGVPAVLSSMQGSLPGGCDAVDQIPVARIVEALENPGGAYQHNGMNRRFPDIRFIWWAGGANFTHHQDTNRLIRAWQKPELVVISECFWTAAAKHADIVLPATTSFERNDLTMTGDYSNQHLVPMKQVVPPRYEARNDFDIFAELSERWEKGGYARFTEGKSELQWLETFYNVARQRGASQQVELPPFAEFWQANQLIEMPENPDSARFIRFADFCRDPQAHPLKPPAVRLKSSRSVLPITLIRIARGIQCGWCRTNGRAMPNRNSYRYFLLIRRIVCTAS